MESFLKGSQIFNLLCTFKHQEKKIHEIQLIYPTKIPLLGFQVFKINAY